MVRDAVNHILRDTNLPMEGNEVYTKVVPSNQSENGNAKAAFHRNYVVSFLFSTKVGMCIYLFILNCCVAIFILKLKVSKNLPIQMKI